jgi:PKD repeat protein
MKKTLFTLLFLAASSFIFGQKVPVAKNDTASFPYWVSMMQDPNANFYATQRAFNLYWANRPITKGCGWKVFKRWEWLMQSRINPDGTLPAPDAVYNAYTRMQDQSLSSSGNWISLGPATIPLPGPAGYEGLGRLNVIGFHPTDQNKIYVGSPSGGLWYSSDGGANWVTLTDGLATLGVSAILVDRVNTSRILIGTGDRDAGDAPGLGVFQSLDGGSTWAASNTGMGNKTVGKLLQHPTNALIILAATSGGVYRSTDGGSNWTLSSSGNFKEMLFKPNDPNTVYAAAGADFYKSTNGGVTFTKITNGITSGQRATIAVTAANPNYVYLLQSDNSSGFKGLYRSTNSGDAFTTRSTSPNILDWSCDGSGTGGQGWYDLSLTADPLNAEVVYVGGVDVWKSTNGGTTWAINSHWYGGCSVPAVHADCHLLIYSPVSGKLYACNDGGVWWSADGGTNWTDITVGMTIGQIYKLGQSQTVREQVINGFQDNGTYTYTASGWLATGGGDGMECAVDYTNAAYTYYTLYYGDIYRRYNNGSEKHIAGNGIFGITESGAWVTPFILSEANHKGMFVGYKNVWRCNDVTLNGLTWEKISDNLAGSNGSDLSVLEQSPANPNLLYAARSDNKFFRSDNCLDAVPGWYDLTSYLPSNSGITDIETHPTEPNTVYLTIGTGVYKSTDKGLTWTSITGNLPGIHLNTITYYKNSVDGLYVGSDAGVYYSDPNTAGWIPFSSGLPASARVTELEIYYDNDSVSVDALRASTYGRGVWSSDLYHAAPVADFEANQVLIPPMCSINFTDLSTGVPTNWEWTFEGGTPGTSNVKNPQNILYPNPGVFQVKLIISNELGADTVIKTGYITVNPTLHPVVSFTADKNVLCTGDIVHFTDQTIYCPSSWSWEFTPGTVTFLEGTSMNTQNPVVQFDAPGKYDVTLTAYNFAGSGSLTQNDYIISGGYATPFTETFASGFSAQHWTILNPDENVTWDTISVAGAGADQKAAWMNFFDYATVNKRDQLISPAFDFSNLSGATLNFRHAYAQRGPIKDSLLVSISSDCGTSWTRLLSLGPDGTPNIFVTHDNTLDAFYPQSVSDWCSGPFGVPCYSVDLTAWAGQNNIKLMFESYNRRGNNLFLDDINVEGAVGIAGTPGNHPAVKVYPNPTTGLVTFTLGSVLSDATVVIYNVQGVEITSVALRGSTGEVTHTLDLSSYPRGVYFLRVISGETASVQKVILE